MKAILILAVLFVCATLVNAQTPPVCAKGGGMVGTFKFCPFSIPLLSYQDTDKNNYSLSACSPLSDQKSVNALCTANGANICQFSPPNYYPLGNLVGAYPISASSFLLTYTGGSSAGGCSAARSTNVTFTCSTDKNNLGTIISTTQPPPSTKCQYLITVTSIYACNNQKCGGGGGGSSHGWWTWKSWGYLIILIAIVLFITYLIAGIGFLYYRNRTVSVELIPNLEFWKDLPFLLKDGCVYFVQKASFGRLCSGYTTV